MLSFEVERVDGSNGNQLIDFSIVYENSRLKVLGCLIIFFLSQLLIFLFLCSYRGRTRH